MSRAPAAAGAFCICFLQKTVLKAQKASAYAEALFRGSKEARTPDLSRVRRTLIPAELCFQNFVNFMYK